MFSYIYEILNRLLNWNKVRVKENDQVIYVADSNVARLMYYLHCINQVVDLSDIKVIKKYIDYKNYSQLTKNDQIELFNLCKKLDVNNMKNKCLFAYPNLDRNTISLFNSDNPIFFNRRFETFIEFKCDSTHAGTTDCSNCEKRNLKKILVHHADWLVDFFYRPYDALKAKLFPSCCDLIFKIFCEDCCRAFVIMVYFSIITIIAMSLLNVCNIMMSMVYQGKCPYFPEATRVLAFTGYMWFTILVLYLFVLRFKIESSHASVFLTASVIMICSLIINVYGRYFLTYIFTLLSSITKNSTHLFVRYHRCSQYSFSG